MSAQMVLNHSQSWDSDRLNRMVRDLENWPRAILQSPIPAQSKWKLRWPWSAVMFDLNINLEEGFNEDKAIQLGQSFLPFLSDFAETEHVVKVTVFVGDKEVFSNQMNGCM
jgi:hypothetical protein